MQSNTRNTSFRFSEGTLSLWEELAADGGITITELIESSVATVSPDDARRAHAAVAAATANGKLVRQPCEECGAEKAQAHHDDYSKPLEVRWLCAKHHKRWHRDNPTKIAWSTLNVRCTRGELERWREAAHIRRVPLSEWVRKVLDATAEQTIAKKETP